MERTTDQKHSTVEFFKEKGLDDESINRMRRRYNRLENTGRGRASESWDSLGSFGIQKRRLPYVVSKCPQDPHNGLKSEACSYCPCGREALPITSFLPDARNIGETTGKQIAALVAGYPPVLIKSVNKSLEPKIRFLVEDTGREINEIAEYPEFFRHGIKKSLEHKPLAQMNVPCRLSEMLSCNHQKFIAKYGLAAGFS
ncbi:hypothetical protein OPV22_034178 [Ensete ventricosum]|uniref:Uncharacterized protein n=1 Tax=Ensete ventricosum TaxID=4639 RepID=A0AAV8PRR0_ENSVE|nr:hypothetical protein OPV22_034178 [Ensete ventricosum]